MSSKLIESYREKAIIHTGMDVCKDKAREMFKRFGFPTGVIYVDNVVEMGHSESSGFFWFKRDKRTEHINPKLKSKALFDMEITGFIEERKMKKVTGLKVKELLLLIPIVEMCITEPASGKITFNTPAGITRSLAITNFEEN